MRVGNYGLFILFWLTCATLLAGCSRGQSETNVPVSADPTRATATPDIEVNDSETDNSFVGLVYDPIEPAPDFLLTDTAGNLVKLADFRGEILLLYFGFTHCPDACPLTLSTWLRAAKELGDDAQKINFAFITVDPERDSPELLRKHLDLFSSEFIGLWASLDETEDLAQSYNVFMQQVETESAAGYFVNHTTLTFVIDQAGRRVLAHQLNVTVDDLVSDLRYLLDNPPDIAADDPEAELPPTSEALFHPTDPHTFRMAAGQPQFVEIFAFW